MYAEMQCPVVTRQSGDCCGSSVGPGRDISGPERSIPKSAVDYSNPVWSQVLVRILILRTLLNSHIMAKAITTDVGKTHRLSTRHRLKISQNLQSYPII